MDQGRHPSDATTVAAEFPRLRLIFSLRIIGRQLFGPSYLSVPVERISLSTASSTGPPWWCAACMALVNYSLSRRA